MARKFAYSCFDDLTEEDFEENHSNDSLLRRHQLSERALSEVRHLADWITRQLETPMAKKKPDASIERRLDDLEKSSRTYLELAHHREEKTEARLQTVEQQLDGLTKCLFAPQEGEYRRLSQCPREDPPLVQCPSCHEIFVNDTLATAVVCPNPNCHDDGWHLSPYQG